MGKLLFKTLDYNFCMFLRIEDATTSPTSTARSICSRGRSRRMALVVIFFSLGYNFTRFLEFRYDYHLNDVVATTLRENEDYKLLYFTVLYM